MAMAGLTKGTGLALICVTCLIVQACATSRNIGRPLPQPTLTPTQQAQTASPVSTPVLGSIPAECPISTTSPQPKFSALAPVIGSTPVWATWLPGRNVFHLMAPPPYPSTYEAPYGWQMTKVIWEVGPDYSESVTLRGYDLTDNTPLLFQTDTTPMDPLVLDPHQPDHPGSALGTGWAEWGSYLVVPKAGCYRMIVSWPEGNWSITFAAGA